MGLNNLHFFLLILANHHHAYESVLHIFLPMDPLQNVEHFPSSQDLEQFLETFNKVEELPILTNGHKTPDIIDEQLEYEEDLGPVKPQFLIETTPTGLSPSTIDFPGSYNFAAECMPDDSRGNRPWLYSLLLRMVFIDMNKVLIMKFKVSEYLNGLYIRALPVYSSCDYTQEPVNRCPIHSKKDDPDFKAHNDGNCHCCKYNLAGHVLRAHSPAALYQFDMSSQRHSVVMPLLSPQAGDGYITIPFSFACKTSCVSGMQRRPIVLVFTLENDFCKVIGRQVVNVKICACPKRDMERMERDYHDSGEGCNQQRSHKRLSTDNHNNSSSKKVKIATPLMHSSDTDNCDNEIENLKKECDLLSPLIENLKKDYELVLPMMKSLCNKVYRLHQKKQKKKLTLGVI